MAEQFPTTLKPTERVYKAGTYPTRVYRSMSGVTAKRSFGNKATGYELQLRYNNIQDTDAATYLKHYHSTAGGFERFTVPTAVKAGMSTTAQTTMMDLSGITWEYAGPPEIQYVLGSICTMSITLVGELSI